MLGKRLLACANQVRIGKIAADIGTDHGLLPIYLIRRKICPRVIGCDLREGPLQKARENIRAAELEHKIQLRLSDGLQALKPKEVSDIILAGMGGGLMTEILSAAPWLKDPEYRLILQPMSRPETLRTFLFGDGFEIVREAAVFDGGYAYTVITAAYSGVTRPTEGAEPYLGGLPEHPGPAAAAYLAQQRVLLIRRIRGLEIRGASESELGRLQSIQRKMEETIRWMGRKET